MNSMLANQQHFHIRHASDISAARRCGQQKAQGLGFNETLAGRVAIVITEVATNIIKHATEGQILISVIGEGEARSIEVLAIDKGPGIANFSQAQRDGMSTAGTPGNGLGALQRMANRFEVYSRSGQGSAFLVQIWPSDTAPPATAIEYGAVCVPIPGETVCGDAWSLARDGDYITCIVADGLGHGPEAAAASAMAVDTLEAYGVRDPVQLMERAHAALRVTRGAALAIANLDLQINAVSQCGIGNIASCVAKSGGRKQLISHSGIVGHNMRKPTSFTLPCSPSDLLIMASDGIGTQWDLENYPGLSSCHPSLIAGVIYRDHSRGRDDATVFVARYREAHHGDHHPH